MPADNGSGLAESAWADGLLLGRMRIRYDHGMALITHYHAKLFAHGLTKRHSVPDAEKLAGTLLDAQVDLNPHQVEAALFAFRSPLSKGAILADEVGLGKTIEAGLVLAQKWTEGKRRILIITPASLRKQWAQELEEKFFPPSLILEAKNYNWMVKDETPRPFEQKALAICSFQFAARHAEKLMIIPWDLVVMDEAHRQDLDDEIKELKREVRQTGNMPGKLKLQKKVRETKRDKLRRTKRKVVRYTHDGNLDLILIRRKGR